MDYIPKMDHQTQEDLKNQIEKLAKAYVPEWRIDYENPDLGTALAVIFANMQQNTLEKYQDIPLKWKTAFFRHLNTVMRTETPAIGYVRFELVNEEISGSPLPKGTKLTTSQVDEKGESIPVETCEDVYVEASHLQAVYESCDRHDYIGKLWSEEQEAPYSLFGRTAKNLQAHSFCLSQEDMFSISERGEVEVIFLDRRKQILTEDFLQALGSEAVFSYSSEKGFIPFSKVYRKGSNFVFIKGEEQPTWSRLDCGGSFQHWLRCEVKNANPFTKMVLGDIRLRSKGELLVPQRILGAGIDCSPMEFYFPFGEQPSVYEEVYFCCDEALRRKGAAISLSFLLQFIEVPLQMMEKSPINWRLVMPASAVKVEREYDITIANVIWEYFNGFSWVRLPVEKQNENIFDVVNGTHRQKKKLVFRCPEDLKPAMVNAEENYCIRARVLRMNNAFKTLGQYIVPVLSDTYFSYTYETDEKLPDLLYQQNNCRENLLSAEAIFSDVHGFTPFCTAGDKNHAIYFCFSKGLYHGPLRMLSILGKSKDWKRPYLRWQYYSEYGWKDFRIEDETDSMGHSGLISFNGLKDSQPLTCFGEHGYWLRAIEERGEYERMDRRYLPVVEKLYLNCVKAWTVDTDVKEYFSLENTMAIPEFQIQHLPIQKAYVWVDETGRLSKTEEMELEKAGRIYYEQQDERRTWVLWQETRDFQQPAQDGRKYMLDQEKGILRFSAGTNYKLPALGVANGIFVALKVGGGKACNLPLDTVNATERSIGFVNQVNNPLAFVGGCNQETPEEAMERVSAQRKHRFRAVMKEDYQNLAKEASPLVYRSACFTGRREDGSRQAGHITLVLLQKYYEESHHYFPMLKETVAEYLKDKVFINLLSQNRLHIVEPTFLQIHVTADIIVDGFQQIFKCQKAIQEKLRAFLDPISGNFSGKGFDVNVLPTRNQIEMLLMSVPGVKEVTNFMMIGSIQEELQQIDVRLEDLDKIPYVLPVNGEHHISVYGV